LQLILYIIVNHVDKGGKGPQCSEHRSMNNQPTVDHNLVACNIDGHEHYPVYEASVSVIGIYKLSSEFIERWANAKMEYTLCQRILADVYKKEEEAKKQWRQDLHNSALRKLTADEKTALGLTL